MIFKKLVAYSLFFLLFSINAQTTRNINVDVGEVKGAHSKSFQYCIGAGRANEGLRADWQNQLRMVKEDCGFKYIRFHGLLHDDMGVFRYVDGKPAYNWTYIDRLYDFILSIDMKPFVELSFMPKDLASGDKTVFWWKGNVTPPKSYEAYEELIYQLVNHLKERYGKEEVAQWYFEIWNEPNLEAFFSGTQDEYFKMYATAAKAIKKVSKDFRVGGPATAGGQWVPETLDFCAEFDVPLDFIATHTYGVKGFLDEFGKNNLIMKPNPHEMWQKVQNTRKMIDDSKFKDIELHFTEWSSSYSPTDNVHDTYQNATYVLNTLKNSEAHANSMSYWTFTDIFEENQVMFRPFHGGFGLLNLKDIKKPTYFVYDYLNELGPTELKNEDENSWVCKTEDGVQALIWDFRQLDQKGKSNRVFYLKDLPSEKVSDINYSVKGLKDGTYTLEIRETGYQKNDVYTAYTKMGSPANLSRAQEAALKQISKDTPTTLKVVEVKNGRFSIQLPLNSNEIYLVKLSKV